MYLILIFKQTLVFNTGSARDEIYHMNICVSQFFIQLSCLSAIRIRKIEALRLVAECTDKNNNNWKHAYKAIARSTPTKTLLNWKIHVKKCLNHKEHTKHVFQQKTYRSKNVNWKHT